MIFDVSHRLRSGMHTIGHERLLDADEASRLPGEADQGVPVDDELIVVPEQRCRTVLRVVGTARAADAVAIAEGRELHTRTVRMRMVLQPKPQDALHLLRASVDRVALAIDRIVATAEYRHIREVLEGMQQCLRVVRKIQIVLVGDRHELRALRAHLIGEVPVLLQPVCAIPHIDRVTKLRAQLRDIAVRGRGTDDHPALDTLHFQRMQKKRKVG